MGDLGVSEDEVLGHMDWDHDIQGDLSFFDPSLLSDFPADGSFNELSNTSPDSLSLSIGEIEHLLMKDDDDYDDGKDASEVPNHESCNDFLSDVLLDSPGGSDQSSGLVDVSDDKNSNASRDAKIDVVLQEENDNGDDDDPILKKRKRQLRNRDAAVRSRERKKMYVRDLELKSRYLEGECKRLGMLLQCCFAENHALRLSLQNSKAIDASTTKQESAVLLLESLLLGSLLWFLGIMCLLILPGPLQFTLVAIPLEYVDNKNRGSLVPRRAGSKNFGCLVFQSFMMGKRCKASRSRMKPSSLTLDVLV